MSCERATATAMIFAYAAVAELIAIVVLTLLNARLNNMIERYWKEDYNHDH